MNSFMQTLRNLGTTRLAAIAGIAVVLIGFFIFLSARGTGDLQAFRTGLEPAVSGEMAAALAQQNIPYETSAGGSTIMVPSSRIADATAAIATAGLMDAGVAGNELFDSTELGTTNAVQQMNRLRALQGELTRTIQKIGPIQTARVHIVLPERRRFSRQTRKATASILVTTRNRQELTGQQILAIQQLVAAAVPELSPSQIAISDSRGKVYTRIEDENNAFAGRSEEQRANREQKLARNVEEQLENIVGAGNVRAQVTLDMDFNRETVNDETFDPDAAVPRSVQTEEETREETETTEDPVSIAQQLPDADNQIGSGAGSFSRSQRNIETTNFEISKKIRTHVRETPEIKRLTVGVVLNEAYQIKPNGDPVRDENGLVIYSTRSDAEVQLLEEQIRAIVGFDPVRGDQISLTQLRFQRLFPDDIEKIDTILGFPKEDFYQYLRFVLLGIVALLVILLVIRPLIARALEATQDSESGVPLGLAGLPERPGGPALASSDMTRRLDESAEMEALEQMIDINQVEGRVRASSLRKIGEIVDKHPEEAVAILRNWMYQDAQ